MTTRYLAEYLPGGDAIATPATVAGVGAVPQAVARGPFIPSDISGLKIWLKADAGAGSSDGDPVGTWTDQSGTSHNFTQSTAGKKPLYKVNIQNGLPVVRFDGSDDELNGGDLSSVFTSAGSMFCAGNPTDGGNNFALYKTKEVDQWWSFGGTGYWGVFRSSRLGSTGSGFATGWHIWTCTADGSAYKVWQNGVNKINAGSFTFDGGNNHNLMHQATFPHYDPGDIGELIVYDSVLSDADRIAVEQYLASRWAIALPDGYATPATVAGIGSVPAPTVLGDVSTTPATVAGTGAVPAPTAFSVTVATPSTVAGVGAVPAPTAKGASTASPSRVVGVGAVPSPTAIGEQAAFATPLTVRGIGRIYRPTFPSSTSPGGGSGGSGGTGVSEVSALWHIELY